MNTEQSKSQTSRFLKAFGQLSGGTLFSRFTGFVREIIAAALFGAGSAYDAFIIAFSVPNLFRRIFGEDMFEQAFLPRFRRLRSKGLHGLAGRYLGRVFVVVMAAVAVTMGVIYCFIPAIVRLLAPGMDTSTRLIAISLAYKILPFILLIALATFAGAVLLFSGDPDKESKNRIIYATAPAVWNLVIIASVLMLHRQMGVAALATAYLLGTGAFIVFQLPRLFSVLRRLKGTSGEKHPTGATKAFAEAGKIFATALVNKTVDVVDRMVASLVSTGAISALWFSFRIVQLPFAIISLSISRSIAPHLSKFRGRQDRQQFLAQVRMGLSFILYLLVPVTLLFVFLAPEIVTIFFRRGAFGQQSVDSTAQAFTFYALALIPMGLVGIFRRVYASLEDNKVPLIAAGTGAAINIVLDLALYRVLAQGGIALATALALYVNTCIMVLLLKKYGVALPWKDLAVTLCKVLLAACVLVPVFFAARLWLTPEHSFLYILLSVAIVSIIGFTLYALLLFLLVKERKMPDKKRIVLTGGGTGGHVYPSLAILDILRQEGAVDEVLYLGISGRAEAKLVPRRNIAIQYVRSAPFSGGSALGKLKALTTILAGSVQASVKLLRFRPHLVIGTGGYASAPVIFAAFMLKPLLKCKIILEEQNLVPGLLNKAASLLANAVLVNYRESNYFLWSPRCVHVGYPLRKAYWQPADQAKKQAKKELNIPESSTVLLVSGGSLGARSINRALAAGLDALSQVKHLQIVHSVGMADTAQYHAVADTKRLITEHLGDRFDAHAFKAYDNNGRQFYQGHSYLHNMPQWQQAADLIISRAGAGSLAEIMALGKPALVVPKRGLPGDHQELNAIGLAEKEACVVVFEHRDMATGIDCVDPQQLQSAISALLQQPERLVRLGAKARALHFSDFRARIFRTIDKLSTNQPVHFLVDIQPPQFVKFQYQFDYLIGYLDKVIHYDANHLYCRLYNAKIDEYLASGNYLVKNKAIKLIGALRRKEYYQRLAAEFPKYQGYLRRNTLQAFRKAWQYQPVFADALRLGLWDGYYETRREAVALYIRFYAHFANLQGIEKRIIQLMRKRSESFEVKAKAIQAVVLFMGEDDFYRHTRAFLHARNVRLRQALLAAIQLGIKEKRLIKDSRIMAFLDQMLITTSEFRPEYGIKERYNQVLRSLEEHRRE